MSHTNAPAAWVGRLQLWLQDWGIRLGLLNNNKPNAARLLDGISRLTGQRHGLAGTVPKQKPHASVGADNLDAYVREVQAVVVAIGD